MLQISAIQKNAFIYFILFITLYILLKEITNYWFLTDDSLYEYYKDRYNQYRLDKFVENRNRFQFLNYIFPVIYHLLKFAIIGGVIAIGIYFNKTEISFAKIFTIVCIAELSFLLPSIVKQIWFGFWSLEFTVEEYKGFGKVSLFNLFQLSQENKLAHLFKALNLYELIYILLLSMGIKFQFKFSFLKSLRLILTTYGTLLLFYFALIMFLITLKN